jgi:hypothetical protein
MKNNFRSRIPLHLALVCAWMLLTVGAVRAQLTYAEAGLGLNFNGKDIFADINFGASIQQVNASVKVSFQPRLGTETILQESDTPNLLYQYRERRFLLGVEADKRFKLTDLGENGQMGLFVGAFGGVAFADYLGTDTRAGTGFAYQGMGGAYLSSPNTVIFRLGYQYVPLPTQGISPHRMGISLSIVLSDEL